VGTQIVPMVLTRLTVPPVTRVSSTVRLKTSASLSPGSVMASKTAQVQKMKLTAVLLPPACVTKDILSVKTGSASTPNSNVMVGMTVKMDLKMKNNALSARLASTVRRTPAYQQTISVMTLRTAKEERMKVPPRLNVNVCLVILSAVMVTAFPLTGVVMDIPIASVDQMKLTANVLKHPVMVVPE